MTHQKAITAGLAALLPLVMSLSLPQSEPIAGCPNGFQLHLVADHHDGEMHFHVGTDDDQNGDGWICAQHVSADGNIHLHIDNQVRNS
ncbi:MAG TPA: hypothetical protein VI703_00895 [Anaerolineales bacterium]|nr:hypothetical protein [Anaerolineales bacterium]